MIEDATMSFEEVAEFLASLKKANRLVAPSCFPF
jgi:hypothetical protein